MSANAWAAITAIAVALLSSPLLIAYVQGRRKAAAEAPAAPATPGAATPIPVPAAQALSGIEAILPFIEDLHAKVRKLEERDRKRDLADATREARMEAHEAWDQQARLVLPTEFPAPPPLR